MLIDVTVDGETTKHDIDVDIDGLKLSEAVTVERIVGETKWARMMAGNMVVLASPSTMQALIFAKLKSRYPGLSIDDFDFDLMAVGEPEAVDDSPVVLPMTLPDGTEIDGASEHVDPTRAATG